MCHLSLGAWPLASTLYSSAAPVGPGWGVERIGIYFLDCPMTSKARMSLQRSGDHCSDTGIIPEVVQVLMRTKNNSTDLSWQAEPGRGAELGWPRRGSAACSLCLSRQRPGFSSQIPFSTSWEGRMIWSRF